MGNRIDRADCGRQSQFFDIFRIELREHFIRGRNFGFSGFIAFIGFVAGDTTDFVIQFLTLFDVAFLPEFVRNRVGTGGFDLGIGRLLRCEKRGQCGDRLLLFFRRQTVQYIRHRGACLGDLRCGEEFANPFLL